MYIVVPNEFLKTTTESSSLVIQLPSAPEEGVMAHCCGIPECWLNWQRLVQWQRQYNPWKREEYGYTISQFHNHAQSLKVVGHWTIKLGIQTAGHYKTLPKFGFRSHTAVFHCPAKFDCPVARQKFSFLATAHD